MVRLNSHSEEAAHAEENNKGVDYDEECIESYCCCSCSDIPGKTKEFAEFAHRTVDSLIEINGTLTSERRAELKKQIESKAEKAKL